MLVLSPLTVLWLSFTYGTPGDPSLGYTLQHYRDTFFDRFTYGCCGTRSCSRSSLSSSRSRRPADRLAGRAHRPARQERGITLMTITLLIPGFAVAPAGCSSAARASAWSMSLMVLLRLFGSAVHISSIVGMGLVEGLSLAPIAFLMTSVVLRAMDPRSKRRR